MHEAFRPLYIYFNIILYCLCHFHSYHLVNFITFRPEIKDVKVKKVELTDNIYHVFGDRTDKRSKCYGKKMNIHDYRVINIISLSYGIT